MDFLFELDSKFGTPNLKKFEALNNKEMFWVITEIVSEPNRSNRAKMIKEFIKVNLKMHLYDWRYDEIESCISISVVYTTIFHNF